MWVERCAERRMVSRLGYLKALDLGILGLLQALKVFGGFFLSFIELISKSRCMSLHILELGITGVDLRKNQGGGTRASRGEPASYGFFEGVKR